MILPRSILMPLSTSGNERERILGALSVAKHFGAHLDVLHAQLNPRKFIPEESIARHIPQKMLHEFELLAEKYSETGSTDLYQLFTQLCQQQNVEYSDISVDNTPSAFWKEINGLRSELVGEYGKVSDLIIVPKPKNGLPTSTLEAAIMNSGKPVLLVPRTMSQFKADRILIPWNSSTECARAVSSALPMLTQAKEVIITCSKRSSTRKPGPRELMTYLQRHEVELVFKKMVKVDGTRGAAILDLCHQLNVDLIVMGAFSRLRLQEQIFGGVTRHMVAETNIPVFMQH